MIEWGRANNQNIDMESLENLLGQKVSKIRGVLNLDFQSGAKVRLLDEVYILLEMHYIRISTIPETDEVSVDARSNGEFQPSRTLVDVESCHDLAGSTFSEYWKCTNSRGYFDLMVLGFQRLHPSLVVLCEGSALKLFRVSSVANEPTEKMS